MNFRWFLFRLRRGFLAGRFSKPAGRIRRPFFDFGGIGASKATSDASRLRFFGFIFDLGCSLLRFRLRWFRQEQFGLQHSDAISKCSVDYGSILN